MLLFVLQVQKTPVRPGKGVKRKHQSPATPATKITGSKNKIILISMHELYDELVHGMVVE